MLRDRIVFGTNCQKAKERLIIEGDTLALEKTMQIAQTHEYSEEQLRRMNNAPTTTAEVHAVKSKNSTYSYTLKASPTSHGSHTNAASKQQTRNQAINKKKSCGKRGLYHSPKGTCPAKGRKCNKCKMEPFGERVQVKGRK